jgi:hypothetical protein
MDEAEEDDESGAGRPEQQRRPQPAQQRPVEVAAVERPARQQDRAEEGEEGEGLADGLVPEVSPEGEHRHHSGGGEADCQKHRHLANAAPRGIEARCHPRQRRQDQVERELESEFALHRRQDRRSIPG